METFTVEAESELATVVDHILALATDRVEKATVLALHGDLGTGKTTFTQVLARRLGVTESVTSPTFVIMKGYELCDQPFDQLIHIDAYRVEQSGELRVLGFDELLQRSRTLIVIEWAEKVADLLPKDTIDLRFTVAGETRIITLSHG